MNTRVYPEVSGLAAWSKNCKWYSSLPLGAVVLLFCEVSLVSFATITLHVTSQQVFIAVVVVVVVDFIINSVQKLFDTPSYTWPTNLIYSAHLMERRGSSICL
jgi:hypothetical protein